MTGPHNRIHRDNGNRLLADVIDAEGTVTLSRRGVVMHHASSPLVTPPPSCALVSALLRSQNVEALCDATISQLEELFRLAKPGAFRDAIGVEYRSRFAESIKAEAMEAHNDHRWSAANRKAASERMRKMNLEKWAKRREANERS